MSLQIRSKPLTPAEILDMDGLPVWVVPYVGDPFWALVSVFKYNGERIAFARDKDSNSWDLFDYDCSDNLFNIAGWKAYSIMKRSV